MSRRPRVLKVVGTAVSHGIPTPRLRDLRGCLRGRTASAAPCGSGILDITDEATEVTAMDRHVGKRICLGRERLGLSVYILAERLGRSEEDILRIEGGAIRPRASELAALASLLEVPVSFFFEEIPAEPRTSAPDEPGLGIAEGLRLIRLLLKAPAPVRARILEMAERATEEG